MHKTLERQLKKYFGSEQNPPKEWADFLAEISDTYTHYDEDHALIERSLDISSKEHTENAEKLRASERHLRTLVETVPDIIVRMDKNLRLVFISQQVTQSIGLPPTELVGKTDQELPFPRDIVTLWESKLKEVFTSGKPITFEFSMMTTNGRRFMETRLVPEFNSDNKPDAIVGVTRDITDKQTSQDALKASEERFLAFMENSPAVAWMKDAEGKYTYINSVFGKRFNTSLEAIRGKTDFDFFPESIAQTLKVNDQQVLETGKQLEVEEIVPTPDGKARAWLTYKFPFADEKGGKLIGGMAIDITQQKLHEEVLKSRTQELEMLNKTMIGRELKMIELKQKITELEKRVNNPG